MLLPRSPPTVGGADDGVPAYYSTGIRAFTPSIANMAPPAACRYVVLLYAFRARRRGFEVSVMKTSMNILALSGGRVRPPLVELQEADLVELRALASTWASVQR